MIHHRFVSRPPDPAVSRHDLLVSSAAGGGLMLSLSLPLGDCEAAGAESFSPNAFVQIGSDGRITLTMPDMEMTWDTRMSIAMLIAEELEVGLNRVRLEHAAPNAKLGANPLPGAQPNAIRDACKPLREAVATARLMLVAAAAKRWNVDAKSCRAQAGVVTHVHSGRRLRYGELAAAAVYMPVPANVTPRVGGHQEKENADAQSPAR